MSGKTWAVAKSTLATNKLAREVVKTAKDYGEGVLDLITKTQPEMGKKVGESFIVRRTGRPDGTTESKREDLPIDTSTYSENTVTITVAQYAQKIPITELVRDLSEFEIVAECKEMLARMWIESFTFQRMYALLVGTKQFYTPTAPAAGTFDYDGTLSTAVAGTSGMTSWHLRDLAKYLRMLGVPEPWRCIGYPGAFSNIWETAKAGMVYTDTSILKNREVKRYEGFEFYELNVSTPPTIGKTTTAHLTPVTGRTTAYTSETRQKYLGYRAATNFEEFIVAGGNDVLRLGMVSPMAISVEEAEHGTEISIAYKSIYGVGKKWNETALTATTARGRCDAVLVSGTGAMTY